MSKKDTLSPPGMPNTESMDDFILPDKLKPKKASPPKKEVKMIEDVVERLPRVNRTLVCNGCSEEKILNPDQYQLLYDYNRESEEKARDNFLCKGCQLKIERNPFEVACKTSGIIHELSARIKDACEEYSSTGNPQILQQRGNDIGGGYGIPPTNIQWIVENSRPVGISILHFPFVGTVNIKVYESKEKRITISR